MAEIISLCLACSGSLPPSSRHKDIFHSKCCSRPICPSCIERNPRLGRYNPCLACLAGVSAVASGSRLNDESLSQRGEATVGKGSKEMANLKETWSRKLPVDSDLNLDGSLSDADLFVVGDDEDDEDVLSGERCEASVAGCRSTNSSSPRGGVTPPPAYSDILPISRTRDVLTETNFASNTSVEQVRLKAGGEVTNSATGPNEIPKSTNGDVPGESLVHYVQKNDTLLGIALKYGVEVRLFSSLGCQQLGKGNSIHMKFSFPSTIRAIFIY